MVIALGLMSGTSMDGIDAALIETDGRFRATSLGHVSVSYPPYVHYLLKAVEDCARQGREKDFSEITFRIFLQKALKLSDEKAEDILGQAQSHLPLTFEGVVHLSTALHREAIQALLALYPTQVDVIGYHGQTLYHNPAQQVSLQIGDGQWLASATGLKVVNNFRIQDIHAGGQGAPFAPLYHQALAVRDGKLPLAVVNCGGISNLTIIRDDNPESLISYDPGPGNSLIDQFVTLRTQGKFTMDRDGQFGRTGQVNKAVLDALLQEAVWQNHRNYLDISPPKSLDIGDLRLITTLDSLSLEDGCATLEALTAEAIVRSLDFISPPYPKHWVLGGGGWYNPIIKQALVERIQQRVGADAILETADEAGWNNRALEAEIFAYLAVRHLKGLPTSYPATTGARVPTVGGTLFSPKPLSTLSDTPLQMSR